MTEAADSGQNTCARSAPYKDHVSNLTLHNNESLTARIAVMAAKYGAPVYLVYHNGRMYMLQTFLQYGLF